MDEVRGEGTVQLVVGPDHNLYFPDYGGAIRRITYSATNHTPVAAIAANAAIGLMQPVLNGIGGDLFAIVYDPKTKKLYGYNSSGRSPASWAS